MCKHAVLLSGDIATAPWQKWHGHPSIAHRLRDGSCAFSRLTVSVHIRVMYMPRHVDQCASFAFECLHSNVALRNAY